jgi:hypothetical protein
VVTWLVALVAYGAVAGNRLWHQSPAAHFVLQANAWVHGHSDIDDWPGSFDDHCVIEEAQLDDGRVVRGRRVGAEFRIAGGERVPTASARHLRDLTFVSFPPVPSIFFVPQALISGARANDVMLSVLVASLCPPLVLLLLGRLRKAGLSKRTDVEDLWLTGMFAFGSVFFFVAAQGTVWFTAHCFGVAFAALFLWATVECEYPIASGLALGLAFGTRTPMLFMFPLFLFEWWRVKKKDWKTLIKFAAPLGAICVGLAIYNYARFHELGEFGHTYLQVRQRAQIDQFGLLSLHYLGRNLAVAFTLMPSWQQHHVSISGHGLALWLTTPAILLVLWPRERNVWFAPVALVTGFIALLVLCYQNSGWVQFGYRFSLDWFVLAIVLLAIGGRPLGRVTKALIIAGVVVNLYGAIVFNRDFRVFRLDGNAYDCIQPN